MEFSKDSTDIHLNTNGRYVNWHCDYKEDGSYYEIFFGGYFNSVFYQTQIATITSGFFMHVDDRWGSPKFLCNINGVTIGSGEEMECYPVEQYYDVFEKYMLGYNAHYPWIHGDFNDERDFIIRMFGGLIRQHSSDLISTDQSWRIEQEKKD